MKPWKCPECGGGFDCGMYKVRVFRHESDGSETLRVILICGECGYKYDYPRLFYPYCSGGKLAGYDEKKWSDV